MYLSIVIPCYNEEKIIVDSMNQVLDFLSKYTFDYEVIPVNDGSKDRTLDILEDTFHDNKKVQIVSYEKNQGKGHAVKEGISHATGDYILFMDADLSTELSALDTFLDAIKDHDVVIASRRHKDSVLPKPQGPLRHFIGNCCIILTTAMTGIKVKDTQCGFKGFRHDIAKSIISKQTLNGWAFDVEYLYIAKTNQYSITEIPITWTNDTDSRVSPIKSSISFFGELIKIVKNKSHYKIG